MSGHTSSRVAASFYCSNLRCEFACQVENGTLQKVALTMPWAVATAIPAFGAKVGTLAERGLVIASMTTHLI
jgi:hypothetical protein